MCFFSRRLPHEIMIRWMSLSDERGGSWTLLTGHGRVLVEIARNPEAGCGISAPPVSLNAPPKPSWPTWRPPVTSLGPGIGRRTRYTVKPDSFFRHSAQEGHRVGPFLDLLAGTKGDTTSGSEGG